MQHNSADQLDIVMNHVPNDHIPAGAPLIFVQGLISLDRDVIPFGGQLPVKFGGRYLHHLIFGKTPGGIFHYGKSFR